MSGYLHFYRNDEDSPVGRILDELRRAGNAYHNTEGWSDDESALLDEREDNE